MQLCERIPHPEKDGGFCLQKISQGQLCDMDLYHMSDEVNYE
jgi:hypothetical protein